MTKYSNDLIDNFPDYLFNKINQQKLALRQSGEDVIDLGYGNPDIPSHELVVDEPGGLFWYETLEFLKEVFKEKNVVGFDIVELCPNGNEKSSDFLAAKLYYKMLSYKFKNEDEEENYEDTYEESNRLGNYLKFDEDVEY